MDNVKNRIICNMKTKWNKETCYEEAKKYSTKTIDLCLSHGTLHQNRNHKSNVD